MPIKYDEQTDDVNSLRTACRLVKTNEVSILKPIRDIVIEWLCIILEGNAIDSDWLLKYKCHVINQSEMLKERQ